MEALRLNWLESVTADGYPLGSFVRVLQMSYTLEKVVACEALAQGVIDRLQNVYDVLKKLQRQTREDGDDASELRELLRGLLFDVHWLRELLERFSKEDVLVQFIRSQKLIDCLEQAHERVDAFVDGVQRSRYGEKFNELAASARKNLRYESERGGYWPYQHSTEFEPERKPRDPATCPFLDAIMNPRISESAFASGSLTFSERSVWTLEYEKQRLLRSKVFNPLLDLVENELWRVCWELRVFKDEAKVTPWFIPSDEIAIGHEIGSGGFWRVYRATWGGSEDIAVKWMIRFDKAALLRVINTSSQLNHPHILRFYGASLPDSKCSVVFESAGYGSLCSFWINTNGSVDTERQKQLWRLLYEAALGIHYIHQQGYVHGSLMCNNILVGDDLKAKLGGFTLGFKNGDHENVPCSEAHHWSAPECLDRTQKTARSFPSDVYSFDMCIVEALTICPPYGGSMNVAVRGFVRRGTLPISVSRLAPQVQELVKAMCAFKPSARMKLEDVIATLKQFADANDPDLLVVSE